MAALTYSPFGLRPIRYRGGYGPNFGSGIRYFIKQGYGSAIAFGDLVYTINSGANQGYIAPYAEAGTVVLGVFLGLLPYYDLTYNTTINKNYYAGTENPSGDIECFIADDPTQIYVAQCNGGPILTAARGQNIDFGGGGAPNSQGLSTGYLDYSTLATTSTLPLRVVGWSALAAPGYDPTQATSANQPTNNYAEVTLNPGACETLLGTGR